MKLFKLSVLCFAFFLLWSCKKDNKVEKDKEELAGKLFLVDKIHDYHDRLLAEYFYNESGNLVKRSTYDPVNHPGIKTTDFLFSYAEGRISRIVVVDYISPQFNHDILIFYNSTGDIIRDETYQYGNMITYKNYVYQDSKIAGITDDSNNQHYFISYNGSANAEQSKVLIFDDGNIGNDGFVEVTRNFIYDDHRKPDFGIGKVFQVEPFPGFGNEATIEKNISGNNMLEFVGGSKWIYTYNADGLPATVETKWKDVETTEPMLMRITYKELPATE